MVLNPLCSVQQEFLCVVECFLPQCLALGRIIVLALLKLFLNFAEPYFCVLVFFSRFTELVPVFLVGFLEPLELLNRYLSLLLEFLYGFFPLLFGLFLDQLPLFLYFPAFFLDPFLGYPGPA